MEAPNGKNPVYHVGKIHTLVADELAMVIGDSFNCGVNVYISCKIGDNLYMPQDILIEIDKDVDPKKIQQITNEILSRRDWTEKILKGALIPAVYRNK
jgi:S-adenosylmethionine synthetase